MIKVIVEDGNLDRAISKFKKVSAETRKEVLKHQFYLRPGLKRALKSKEAQRRNAAIATKLRKKYEAYLRSKQEQ